MFQYLHFSNSQIDAPATVNYSESVTFSEHLLCSLFADILPRESRALIRLCSYLYWYEPSSSQRLKEKGSWLTHSLLYCYYCFYYVCT